MRLRTLGAVCATCAAAVPSSAVAASPASPAAPATPPLAGPATPPAGLVATAAIAVPVPATAARPSPVMHGLVEKNIALKQRHLRLFGDRLTRSERRDRREILHGLATAPMRLKNLRLARDIRELRARLANRYGGAPDVPIPPQLAAIARCESGGNPRAVSSTGMYRGKYQFSFATWRAVGGKGDPAQASETEQDRRAAILYRRAGPGQWPVCGR